jgi:hypothetical protein
MRAPMVMAVRISAPTDHPYRTELITDIGPN